MKKPVIVTQTPGKEVPTEILAEAIVEISRGMKHLRSGRLNDRALILLLQDACGRGNVTRDQIQIVINALEGLADTYVKKVRN